MRWVEEIVQLEDPLHSLPPPVNTLKLDVYEIGVMLMIVIGKWLIG